MSNLEGQTISEIARQLVLDSRSKKSQGDLGMDDDYHFFIMATGSIESGIFGSSNSDCSDQLYVRYLYTFGPDWSIVHGVDNGLSQVAQAAPGHGEDVIWNFPIDISFKSTNPHGWPRIALSVYTLDSLGRDVVKGYGSVLLPTSPGEYELTVATYAPVALTPLSSFLSWLMGTPPEFYDSSISAKAEGREVTRVRSTGLINVKINITTKGMAKFGFET